MDKTKKKLLSEYHLSGAICSFEDYLIYRIEVLEEKLAQMIGEKVEK